MCAGSGLQEGERAGGELVLLDKSNFIFPVEIRNARLVLCFMYGFSGMHRNVSLVGFSPAFHRLG